MRKMAPKWLGGLALLFSIVITCGCGQPVQQTGTGKHKDELIISIGGEPEDGFDPTLGWGRYGSPLFQSTLLKRDHQLQVTGDLATSYAISEDGLEWTFQLREDVRFSDGEPLTAEDVVYTFQKIAETGSVVDVQALERVEAVGEHQVKFFLKQPRSTFLNTIINTGIVPKHAHGLDYATKPIGSGPYRLLQWDRGQQLIVEANPLYYGEQPYFKKITFLYLSEEASFAAAKAGQVDISLITPALAKQEVAGMRLVEIETVDNRGIMFPYVPAGGKTEEGFPVGNDVTADRAIRQAINIAIDRQKLIDGILDGFGSPAYTVNDRLPWWNPETVIADGNLEEAASLLEEHGWTDTDGDGILEKDGQKAQFALYYPPGDWTRQALAIAVADMIRPLGIDITAEMKSWDELRSLMHANAVLFGWGSHDPLEMYNLYSSKTIGSGWYNPGFYANPQVDDYLEQAMAATSEAEANHFWQQAQWDGQTGVSAKGDAPWAWLVNVSHLYLVRDKLDIGQQAVHPHGHGWPLTDNVTEWKWLEE